MSSYGSYGDEEYYYIKYNDKDTGELVIDDKTYENFDDAFEQYDQFEDEGHENIEIWVWYYKDDEDYEECNDKVYPNDLQYN